MAIWLVIFGLLAVLCILGAAHLTWTISRFGLIKKISRGKKWPARGIAFALIVLGVTLFTLVLSFIDALVVLVHVLFFSAVYGLIIRIVQKASGRQFRMNWQGWLALVTTAIYLSAGYYLCNHVWETTWHLSSDKKIGSLRIAMLADSHMGTTFDGEGFAAYIDKIMLQEPDIILIPGDFVDDGSTRTDMIRACEALGNARPKYGVWFAYGNHDKGILQGRDFTAVELAETLEKNQVHILEDEFVYIDDLCIVGRKDAAMERREELADILKEVDTEKYIIVMDHEPSDYEMEALTPADLVVSGHTHGGQLIPLGNLGVWLGINDRFYGCEQRSGTDFIVTSGISDWALHFKTGTKSEYVIIDVEGD